MEPQSIQDH